MAIKIFQNFCILAGTAFIVKGICIQWFSRRGDLSPKTAAELTGLFSFGSILIAAYFIHLK